MNFIYSAANNMFYPYEYRPQYELSGDWPSDGIDVSDDVFAEFTGTPPEGKMRGPVDDLPAWVDIPLPTPEQEVEAAEGYRQQLLRQIDDVTADWRVELMLGDISDEDKAKLTEWMAYKKEVKAVDTSTAPDITWPEPPAA